MDKQSILKKLKEELEESHQNYLDGKGIPWEDLDWGMPRAMTIAESGTEYHVQREV